MAHGHKVQRKQHIVDRTRKVIILLMKHQQCSAVAFRRHDQAHNHLQLTARTMRWVIIPHCPQRFVSFPDFWLSILILSRSHWYLSWSPSPLGFPNSRLHQVGEKVFSITLELVEVALLGTNNQEIFKKFNYFQGVIIWYQPKLHTLSITKPKK